MNKRLFGLQDVSGARNFIYGAAIVWIVFFHSGFSLKAKLFETIKFLKLLNLTVVAALKFSFCFRESVFFIRIQKTKTLAFYKRRLAKILPPYFIIYGIVFNT